MKKNLIVFYSLQGSTKRVAQLISETLGGDILELQMEKNYNLLTAWTLGGIHIKSEFCPDLKRYDIDLQNYENIFIGTPVWYYTFVPPIRTFIAENDLSGKNIMLFSTHKGGNGQTFSHMTKLLNCTNIAGSKDFYNVKKSSTSQLKGEILDWVNM